jgi:hypothetical protein
LKHPSSDIYGGGEINHKDALSASLWHGYPDLDNHSSSSGKNCHLILLDNVLFHLALIIDPNYGYPVEWRTVYFYRMPALFLCGYYRNK